MIARRGAALALFLVFLAPLFSEDAHEPIPYAGDEFYSWQKDLRRAEIITFGSLPFVTFMASIYFDIYRYYDNDKEEGYKPWPFKKSDTAIALTEDEQKRLVAVSAGIALGVAAFDYGFRAIRRAIRNAKADRLNQLKYDPIKIEPIVEDSKESGGTGDSGDSDAPETDDAPGGAD